MRPLQLNSEKKRIDINQLNKKNRLFIPEKFKGIPPNLKNSNPNSNSNSNSPQRRKNQYRLVTVKPILIERKHNYSPPIIPVSMSRKFKEIDLKPVITEPEELKTNSPVKVPVNPRSEPPLITQFPIDD